MERGWIEDDEESALAGVALEAYVKGFSLHESYYAVEGGLIPEYLWKSGMVNPIAAGFVDGAWQTIEGTWGIVNFLAAWQPNNFSAEALQIRMATWQFVQFLNELVTNPETRAQTWDALSASFSDYIDETLGLDNQALYNQGKLVFDVITLFIGVGEVKAILNGQKVTIGIVALMQAVPKHLSKFVFKVRQLGLSIVKEADKLLIKDGAQQIALVADNALQPTMFFEEGQQMVTEGSHTLVKNGQGKYGFLKKIVSFTTKQIDDYVKLATKNPDAKKVMLGKYKEPGTLSYIQRAGADHTYFDMGKAKWDEAKALVNNGIDNTWESEMWRINKQFIDEQKALAKEFFLSHEPWKAKNTEFLSKEAEYLIDIGAKDFEKIADDLWKVIW